MAQVFQGLASSLQVLVLKMCQPKMPFGVLLATVTLWSLPTYWGQVVLAEFLFPGDQESCVGCTLEDQNVGSKADVEVLWCPKGQ